MKFEHLPVRWATWGGRNATYSVKIAKRQTCNLRTSRTLGDFEGQNARLSHQLEGRTTKTDRPEGLQTTIRSTKGHPDCKEGSPPHTCAAPPRTPLLAALGHRYNVRDGPKGPASVTYIHIYIHTHIHTYIHIHTHTHTSN